MNNITYCSICGAKVQPGAAFCPNCGNRLQFATSVETQRQAMQPGGMPSDINSSPKQYNSYANESTVPPGAHANSAPKKKKTGLWVALGAAVLCVVVVVVLWATGALSSKDSTSGQLANEDEFDVYEEAIQSELYMLLGCDKEDGNVLQNAIYQNFSVEVTGIDQQNDRIVAECVFRNRNFASAVRKIEGTSEKMTYSEYLSLLIDSLGRQSELEMSEQVTINNIDGNLQAAFTEQQFDDATGGLLSYYYSAYSEGDSDDNG